MFNLRYELSFRTWELSESGDEFLMALAIASRPLVAQRVADEVSFTSRLRSPPVEIGRLRMSKGSGGTSLGYKSKSCRAFICSTFVLAGLISVSASAVAQDRAKLATEKWRPKDGLYAEPGTDLGERCMDHTEVVVELAEKSISGNEWNCKIIKLTDVAPDTVRLDATCTELEDKPYKAIFLLKKIDDRTILYSASTKGKKDPGQPMSFCPEQGQRRYAEAKARDLAEAQQKAAEERSKPSTEKWRPKDGPYASLGADFSKRCGDFGDATIDLAEKAVGGSEQKCEIIKLTDAAPGAIRLDVSCVDTEREDPHKEIILLKKVDENTIFYRQTYKEKFKYPGAKYSYCPEEAQRMYIESKKIK
jgi:hypothetical protein